VKHSTEFQVDHDAPAIDSYGLGYLPHAPLAMPKQVLERREGFLAFLRTLILGTFART
jgi:hypothetical protein